MRNVKWLLCCAFLLLGCNESKEVNSLGSCQNGDVQEDGSCVCKGDLVKDINGNCTKCADGSDPVGVNCSSTTGGDGNNDDSDGKCLTTFKYFNQWTKTDACGTGDFDVYLIGSFNEWKTADPNYKMNYDGQGNYSLKLEWPTGSNYSYKFYVAGWSNQAENRDDGYQPDTSNPNTDAEGNGIANITACGQSYGFTGSVDCNNSGNSGNDGNNNGGGNNNDGNNNNKCLTTFKFSNQWTSVGSGGEKDFDVYLAGDFNNWLKENSEATEVKLDLHQNYKMTSDGKGNHSIQAEIPKGTHSYKFYIDGWAENSWHVDPSNSNFDNDGNSTFNINSCGMTIGDGSSGGGNGGNTNGGSGFVPSDEPVTAPDTTERDISFEVNVNGKSITNVSGGVKPSFSGNKISDKVPGTNRYNYVITLNDNSTIYYPYWVEKNNFDWHDALLYFAFTDRFVDGDKSNNEPKTQASVEGSSNAQWMGGDFKGMQKAVEDGYFERLGVNTIWISSVTKNTEDISWGTGSDSKHSYSAYHSYWPTAAFMTDYNKGDFGSLPMIETHFGSLDDLKNLVDACHKRGMRVLVDFAANHVFKDSPMVKKHPDWFNDMSAPRLCDDNNNWDNYSEKCWFSKDLPDINYENPEARKTMVDHAIYLIKETGVDGFRVDAVKHMNIDFIKDLRKAVNNLFSASGITFYMVGETFTGNVDLLNKYIGDDLLHAQFDFPLYYKIGNVLKGNGLYDLAANSGTSIKGNPFKSDLMGTFMGNHDVARAISVAAGQNEGKWGQNQTVEDDGAYFRLKLAWSILLMNPGVPLIYYGDEYGMTGANDPDNRRMMQFGNSLTDKQKSTLGYVQQLGKIRAAHRATRYGKRTDLVVENDKWCFKLEYNEDTLIIGLATQNGGGNCDLKSSYKLKNLLDESAGSQSMSSLDLGANKFQIYAVEK